MALFRLLLVVIFCATAGFILPASAEPVAKTDHVELSLHIDTDSIESGGPFWALLEFTLADGWHIYWKNPGDSGLEAQINWTLPDGFSAGPLHWPAPTRIEYSGLFNYGYEGTVGLLIPLTAPASGANKPFDVQANVEYLICHDICIPESASLRLSVDPSKPDPAIHALVAPYVEQLPKPHTGDAFYDLNAGEAFFGFDLSADMLIDADRIYRAWWYPLDAGIITNDSDQQWRVEQDLLILSAKQGLSEAKDPFEGVLEIATTDGKIHHRHAKATWHKAGPQTPLSVQPAATASTIDGPNVLGLAGALLAAFLGGLILNIMPCVLPVLSLKALSISKKSGADRRDIRLQGIAYTAGIVLSFVLIAGLLIFLQQAGQAIGWGFQLQSPWFVTGLVLVLSLVGLNLSGFYELPSLFGNIGESATQQSGWVGSFFTGVLATIVATPCTAPFMVTALGFAVTQPPAIALLIFVALGIGLAFPFLLITQIPSAMRLLPKPGIWMQRCKQILAFPIYVTIIWLLWVLAQQSGPDGLAVTLIYILLLMICLWVVNSGVHILWRVLVAGITGIVICLTYSHITPLSEAASHGSSVESFSQEALQMHRDDGKSVFVYATAAWCITCKVNERIALSDASVQKTFKDNGIIVMKADWTNRNPDITAFLASFGRNGVPLYAFYAAGKEPVLLPQLLQPSSVIEAITP